MSKSKESRQEQTPQSAGRQADRQPSQAVQRGGGSGAQRGLARRHQYGLSPFGDPFAFMQQFTEEMDRLFDDFGLAGLSRGRRGLGGFGQTGWSPQVEVFRRGNELVVRADLPGIDKEDLKFELTDDALILEGERRQEHEETREGMLRSERSYGSFHRTIPLPDGVDPESANATCRNGVLEVTVQLPEEKSRRRPLEIRDESGEPKGASGKTQTSAGRGSSSANSSEGAK